MLISLITTTILRSEMLHCMNFGRMWKSANITLTTSPMPHRLTTFASSTERLKSTRRSIR